jgi:hypothetical protein
MTTTRMPAANRFQPTDPQPDGAPPMPNQTDKTLAQVRTELLTTFSVADSESYDQLVGWLRDREVASHALKVGDAALVPGADPRHSVLTEPFHLNDRLVLNAEWMEFIEDGGYTKPLLWKRSNETHESTNEPDARLYRKGGGRESRLCYMGQAVMENRNGLAICGEVTNAIRTAEREVVLAWLDELPPRRRITLGATRHTTSSTLSKLSKSACCHQCAIGRNGIALKTAVDRRTTRHPGYAISSSQRAQCHAACCHQCAIGRNGIALKTAVDRRTTRHPGYAISQRMHKRIEKANTTFVLGLEDRCRDHLVANRVARLPQVRARDRNREKDRERTFRPVAR